MEPRELEWTSVGALPPATPEIEIENFLAIISLHSIEEPITKPGDLLEGRDPNATLYLQDPKR